MERGMDPEVKKYFRRIVYSLFVGLVWLVSNATAGIYFGLAFRKDLPLAVIILFYIFFSISLFVLLRYYYRIWKN